ncbi:MAG: hypothetical protein ACF8R9_15445 [Phycisphaerales bacterium JB054]
MPRSSTPQYGRPKGSTVHRIAMYFAGVAIGLILVGLLTQMRQIMVPPAETTPQPAETAPAPGTPASDPGP